MQHSVMQYRVNRSVHNWRKCFECFGALSFRCNIGKCTNIFTQSFKSGLMLGWYSHGYWHGYCNAILWADSWMLKVLLCFYGEMIRWKPHMHAQAHSLSLTLTHSYKSTVFLDWCMTGIKWLKSNPLETNIPCVPSGMSWPCATLRYVLTAHKHTDLQSKEDFFSSFVFLVQPSWTEGFSNLC